MWILAGVFMGGYFYLFFELGVLRRLFISEWDASELFIYFYGLARYIFCIPSSVAFLVCHV